MNCIHRHLTSLLSSSSATCNSATLSRTTAEMSLSASVLRELDLDSAIDSRWVNTGWGGTKGAGGNRGFKLDKNGPVEGSYCDWSGNSSDARSAEGVGTGVVTSGTATWKIGE